MKTSPEYRRTLFDRLGPEAADLFNLGNWLIVPAAGGVVIGGGLALRAELTLGGIILSAFVGAILAAALTAVFALSVSRGAGAAFRSFIEPSGNRTPYERQYSHEDAMVMRGNVDGALASYHSMISAARAEVQPRLRAAEVCMQAGRREEAEAFLREVQQLPRITPREDVYTANRLVDLYRSWPGHETKALREMRRLIDRYPNTDVAARARDGLATLKAQIVLVE